VVSGDRKCEELGIRTSLSQFCFSLDPFYDCAVSKLLHPVHLCFIFMIFFCVSVIYVIQLM
jgi:hypothetical protein